MSARLTTAEFVAKAKARHGNRYDYSGTTYTNRRTKLAIKCRKHGVFYQCSDDHFKGKGCPTCGQPFTTSKDEQAWLNSKRIAGRNRNQRLTVGRKTYVVDALIPRSKTVYEFYGDIWHGNPKNTERAQRNPVNGELFGDLYDRTMRRERALKRAGYKVIRMWEHEWKSSKRRA